MTAASSGPDWVLFWTVVAAIVGTLALIGVGYQVVGYYGEHPRRRIEYVVRTTRMVPEHDNVEELEVFVRNIKIEDPHIVSVTIISNSRADIPSTLFDAGKPIIIRVDRGGAVTLNQPSAGTIDIDGGRGEGLEWAEFHVPPQLIRKRSRGSVTFISAGVPSVTVKSPLIEVEDREITALADYQRIPAARAARFVLFAINALLVGAGAATVVFLIGRLLGWL